MSQNTSPIFSLVPVVSAAQLPSTITASTKSDGTGTIGTDMIKAFSADATNGSFVSKMRILATASAAGTALGATVIRIYISSQTTGSTTSANNWLFQEVTTAALTADSASSAVNAYEVPINLALPPSYTILVSIHAAPPSNTTWQCSVFGGNY